MDKITIGLIAAAGAIGLVAARGARRSSPQQAVSSALSTPPSRPSGRDIDPGIAVLRNDHIDDGMVIRSPFKGDGGIVRTPPAAEKKESGPGPAKDRDR